MYYPKDFENLQRIAAQWTKHIQQLPTVANPPVLQKLAETVTAINSNVGKYLASLPKFNIDPEAIERFRRTGLPPNWWDLNDDPRTTTIVEFMRETRWCLVWAPRAVVVRDLVAADESERTGVFLGRSEQIIADCRSIIEATDASELEDVATAALEVADCLTHGCFRAAQALSAACLSDVIGTKFNLNFAQAKEAFAVQDVMKLPWIEFRRLFVFAMVADSLERYHAHKGDPIPGRFSRHASAHSVSPEQFTEVNALAGLLMTVAVVQEADLIIAENAEREADGAA